MSNRSYGFYKCRKYGFFNYANQCIEITSETIRQMRCTEIREIFVGDRTIDKYFVTIKMHIEEPEPKDKKEIFTLKAKVIKGILDNDKNSIVHVNELDTQDHVVYLEYPIKKEDLIEDICNDAMSNVIWEWDFKNGAKNSFLKKYVNMIMSDIKKSGFIMAYDEYKGKGYILSGNQLITKIDYLNFALLREGTLLSNKKQFRIETFVDKNTMPEDIGQIKDLKIFFKVDVGESSKGYSLEIFPELIEEDGIINDYVAIKEGVYISKDKFPNKNYIALNSFRVKAYKDEKVFEDISQKINKKDEIRNNNNIRNIKYRNFML